MKLRTGDGGWSPYVAGALVGVLALASAVATTKVLGKTSFLGASTTFVRAAGMVERQVAPEHVKANAYFEKEKVKVDWQFMLVIGIFVGALAGALSDRNFKLESVMMSAILVGMVGLQILRGAGVLEFGHKPMNLGAIGLGGLLFGAGWAVMGYCPGTSPVLVAVFGGAFVLFEKVEKKGG